MHLCTSLLIWQTPITSRTHRVWHLLIRDLFPVILIIQMFITACLQMSISKHAKSIITYDSYDSNQHMDTVVSVQYHTVYGTTPGTPGHSALLLNHLTHVSGVNWHKIPWHLKEVKSQEQRLIISDSYIQHVIGVVYNKCLYSVIGWFMSCQVFDMYTACKMEFISHVMPKIFFLDMWYIYKL
jgi:hypothetical protein